MPAPAARLWLNFARLINRGSLPPQSALAMTVAGAVFALTTFAKTYIETQPSSRLHRYQRWLYLLPNGIAFAVGLGLNTPNYSIARLVGGLVVILVNRGAPRRRHASSSSLPPVKLLIWSAGFVLGEGFASIVILLLRELGLGAISCAGCRGGCSAGC